MTKIDHIVSQSGYYALESIIPSLDDDDDDTAASFVSKICDYLYWPGSNYMTL